MLCSGELKFTAGRKVKRVYLIPCRLNSMPVAL